jgi:hypothetical protein
MGSSVKAVRDRARVAHLGEAIVLIAYVYTPLGEDGIIRAFVRILLVPAMVATGLVMWKLPALRRLARTLRPGGTGG